MKPKVDPNSPDLYKEAVEEEAVFRAMLPTRGYFAEYMHYTDRQESPDSYHFWVAATILAATLERRCWISKGVYRIYPNLFTVLVSGSGKCRKTRAILMGNELLKKVPVNVIADKTTPEALVEALRTKKGEDGKVPSSSGLIRSTEFSVFVNKQQYNQAMIPILTDFYDCPDTWNYQTKTGGRVALRDVSLSILGASTPEWLAMNLPDNSFEGGFMSRLILVVRQTRNRHFPWPEEPVAGEVEALQAHLIRIRQLMVGGISLDEKAKGWFERWYESTEWRPATDYQLVGFIERRPDLVLKMAMLLAAGDDRRIIDVGDMRQAYEIVQWTQKYMFAAFKHVGMSRMGAIANEVLQVIDSCGGKASLTVIGRRLAYKLEKGRQDLRDALELLTLAEQIIRVEERVPGAKGPTGTVYVRNLLKVDEEGYRGELA